MPIFDVLLECLLRTVPYEMFTVPLEIFSAHAEKGRLPIKHDLLYFDGHIYFTDRKNSAYNIGLLFNSIQCQ